MEGKWKYPIYTIIVLDLIYFVFYGYNRYIHIPKLLSSRTAIANSDSISVSTEFILPFDYGDRMKDHFLTDVAGKIIDISSTNKNFKFLNIIQPPNPDNFNIDYFNPFIDIRKEFVDKDIIFLYLNVGEFSEKNKKELRNIQEKFNINICSISKQFMKDYYNLPNCRCGFTLFLDRNNQVKFANKSIELNLIKTIIEREYER